VLTQPLTAELGTASGWFRKSFTLTDNALHQPLGSIREPSALTLRRELLIELPEMAPSVAAFLGIVTLIVRY